MLEILIYVWVAVGILMPPLTITEAWVRKINLTVGDFVAVSLVGWLPVLGIFVLGCMVADILKELWESPFFNQVLFHFGDNHGS